MNCDEAFDRLTRGPFPSGDDAVDDVVERHLSVCYECRQLAEALRPAVGLFHEALAGAESLSLPGYRGRLTLVGRCPRPAGDREPAQGTQTLAAPVNETHTSKAAPRCVHRGLNGRRGVWKRAVMFWPALAAGVIGLVLGVMAESLRSRTAAQSVTADSGGRSSALALEEINREGRLLLASLNLPTACRDTGGSPKHVGSSSYQCCTRCHAHTETSVAPRINRASLSTLTSSCLVCHSDNYRAKVSRSLRSSFSMPETRPTRSVEAAIASVVEEMGDGLGHACACLSRSISNAARGDRAVISAALFSCAEYAVASSDVFDASKRPEEWC